MQIAFPLHVDNRGRSAERNADGHVRDLIEQLLFTAPGERVNRPDFGTGLKQLLFAPASNELATATQLLVQGAVQQWLGELIEVQGVEIAIPGEGRIEVRVVYRLRRSGESRSVEFRREVP
jgi:phage baseplate assembly protein W